jgi:hypothetical protein
MLDAPRDTCRWLLTLEFNRSLARRLTDAPRTKAGSGEVLIRVHGAAVNPVSAPRQSSISTTEESKRMVLLTPKNPIRMEIWAQVIDKDIVSSSTLVVTGSTTPLSLALDL